MTENVLLVVIDALRPDRVGAYGEPGLTPNLDRLAADGETFERCYASINATDASMTTLSSGLYPTHHGVLNHGKNVTEREQEYVSGVELLPELLDDHRSVGIDMLGRWHGRGYDEYVDPDRRNQGPLLDAARTAMSAAPDPVRKLLARAYRRVRSATGGPTSYGIDAGAATDAAVERLDGSPWFALVHYWETHCPYVAADAAPQDRLAAREYDETPLADLYQQHDHPDGHWIDWLRENLPHCETVGDVVRRYDAATWHVDRQLGRLLDHLERAGIADETAVIVTADHGESLTEHGILFDHHGLYEPSIHVPLVVDAPGFEGREAGFVQHFDLAPTILDLLGYDYDPGRFDGTSLVPERREPREAAYVEEGHTNRKRAIRTDRFKYVRRLPGGGACRYCGYEHAPDEELYDLQADPGETDNLVEDRPEVAERLAEELSDWVAARDEPTAGRAAVEADDAALERLEEMGYI